MKATGSEKFNFISGAKVKSKNKRKIVIAAIVVVVLILLSFVNLPIWAVAPGKAQEVASLIKIEGASNTPKSGHIFMTDVSLGPVSPVQWLLDKMNSNVELVPSSAILGNSPPSSFIPTQLDEMKQSKQAATVAALSYLGYDLNIINGALIAGIAKVSVVSSVLHVGDLITDVNGTTITSARQFVSVVSTFKPKDSVKISYIPAALVANRGSSGSVAKTVSVTLGSRPDDASKPYLGINITDGVSYNTPFKVTISTPGIGGPSAGLAFTLGIIDRIEGGGLTKGNTIAATGTISPDGSVGDVGGVPQKTITVERAGAKLFLVPPQEFNAAMSKASPELKVEAVSTLKQAVADIEAFANSSK